MTLLVDARRAQDNLAAYLDAEERRTVLRDMEEAGAPRPEA